MMFEWKPEMVRFMQDASEYGNYNKELARVMLPYLGPESRVCDAGCGLGYLSLELAKSAGKVTAVDISNDALSVLEKKCTETGMRNIEIRCGDVFSMNPEEKYTAMVFCYFGDIDDILSCAGQFCSGPVFVFMRNYEMHRFSVGSIRKGAASFEEACRRLDELGIRYSAMELENEFGQPFRTMEDARMFYETYSQDPNKKLITELLLTERLTCTGREDFPFYMPHLKKTGCIVINPRETDENTI